MAVSENGDTDYDINDDDDFDEDEEEEEEEEDDDESCDDDSQVHALIDDLELKFRLLVSTKIEEAEQFFDDANTFQRLMSQSTLIEPVPQNGASFVVNHSGIGGGGGVAASCKEETAEHIQIGSRRSLYGVQCSDMSTQTDDGLHFQKLLGAATTSTGGTSNDKADVEPPEQARLAISQLREVRDSLVSQRQQWAAQLNQTEYKTEEEAKRAESKVFEVEEAIEALDTAIEYKNEVVLGHPPNKSMASNMTPGTSEAVLVTRLESLSIEEIRRLLCMFFTKVVELRSSSRRLEKQMEDVETENEQLDLRIASNHKRSKAVKEEYDKRIRLILNGNNTSSGVHSAFKRMEEQLAAAHKKQADLERSLTELLVRHGYLVNGADYDVKQVVRTLGIESQLAGATYRNQDGGGGSNPGTAVAEQHVPHHSRSIWQRKTPAHLGQRRNGRQLDGQDLPRLHHRDQRLAYRSERENQLEVQPSQPTGVRRTGHKIYIQPSGGGSGPSSGGHSSNHHHHRDRDIHRDRDHSSNPHPHHSNYGGNYHHKYS